MTWHLDDAKQCLHFSIKTVKTRAQLRKRKAAEEAEAAQRAEEQRKQVIGAARMAKKAKTFERLTKSECVGDNCGVSGRVHAMRKKSPSSSLKAMDGSLGECAHAPKPGCTAQIPYISSHSRASDLSWHLMTDSDFLPTQLLQVPGRDPKMVHRGTSAHVACTHRPATRPAASWPSAAAPQSDQRI